MGRYNIVIHSQVKQNLKEIIDYTFYNYGELQALRTYEKLSNTLKGLSFMPQRFRRVSTKTAREIRCCLEGRYRIFYEIYGDTVHILYIRHTSRSDLRFD